MTVHLDDYADLLAALPERARQAAQSEWVEAVRVLSPRGIDNYLQGARALAELGRGEDLVESYLEAVPQVAREIGEDVLAELVGATLAMASKTSGAVLNLMLASSATAAKRLGDATLFRGYLQLLDNLLAQAPRGMRPMLEKLDILLSQLTLGGLRRWATWGAHAHRTNFSEQAKYFGLESREALAMLQKERRGTRFVDVQRRLGMYLRALWGRDFFMRPTSGDYETREGYQPFIADYFLHLPDAFDDWNGVPGVELYRAAAAHCAAHVAETGSALSAEALNGLQLACVGLVEDARVEALAIRRFPGLKPLWARMHDATPERKTSLGDFLDRIARALLDEAYADPHPAMMRARQLFAENAGRLEINQMAWDVGVAIAHELSRLGIPFNPRTDVQGAPYRDDNRYIWEFEEFDLERSLAAGYEPKQLRKQVSLMEFVNEVDVETAGDDAQEIWVLGTELYDDDGVTFNEREGKEPVSDPYHYAEWDYQIQLERPAWATVLERRPKFGELQTIEAIAAEHKRLIARLKYLLDAVQPQGVQRIRKLEDGDEIDLNAAIQAFVDLRMGLQPDPRIMMRAVRKLRDISVLVLLDLSESANGKVAGQEFTVLDLTRAATVLLADAIHRIGDPFAVHGFCSDGRHDVRYYRYKDFDQAYDDVPKSRLAGMTGQLSTRMGAAIRHAGRYLRQQKSSKKLLLVITDGEPADVDVRDPQYLRFDARKAVEDLGRSGIVSYCLTLDPRADQYVSRIFGMRNYTIVDHVERLPEKLPALYMGLTR
jgi:nitric oxide reductase NorD protein